jgi:hypothetical protein
MWDLVRGTPAVLAMLAIACANPVAPDKVSVTAGAAGTSGQLTLTADVTTDGGAHVARLYALNAGATPVQVQYNVCSVILPRLYGPGARPVAWSPIALTSCFDGLVERTIPPGERVTLAGKELVELPRGTFTVTLKGTLGHPFEVAAGRIRVE